MNAPEQILRLTVNGDRLWQSLMDITNKALFNTRTEQFVNAPGSRAA